MSTVKAYRVMDSLCFIARGQTWQSSAVPSLMLGPVSIF